MQLIKVSEKEAGQRLDKFLKRYFPESSSSLLYKMLRKKNITLNGCKSDGSDILASGDEIKTFFSEETYYKFMGKPMKDISSADNTDDLKVSNSSELTTYNKAFNTIKGIEIVYEDKDFIFINKPAGILSQTDENNDISVNEWICGYLINKGENPDFNIYKPSVCNRIDCNTSGLLLGAKSYYGSRYLSDCIKNHTLKKYYLAICEGIVTQGEDLKGYLYKDKSKNKVYINSKGDKGDYIETKYRPIKNNGKYTLLEIQLITGKPHQIRAHLSSINHPLAGDVKYGGKSYSGIKYQMLHANRVLLPDGREFVANPPEYFKL